MEYGLIAEKTGHSFSPEIHRSLGGYDYELRALLPREFDAFMKKRDFKGVNVTLPYKIDVIPYLDYVDPLARKIGAVNTVVNKDGKLFGYNTDFGGMRMMIERSGVSFKDQKVLILGSGGTSRTARAVSSILGAKQIVTVRRDKKNGCITYRDAYDLHGDAFALINTTPCGMFPRGGELPCDEEGAPIDLGRFHLTALFDVVYNPLRTRLLQKAESFGAQTGSGLYMLVAQAATASEYFTGRKYDRHQIDGCYRSILLQKENIVLTGMPGSGKSTLGRIVAEKLGAPFYDTDEEIVKKTGLSIKEIFEKKGEAFFRDLESETVEELSSVNGCVISTGGGAVLREENVLSLRRNGRIFFIDRSPSRLLPTSDRPLADSSEKIEKLYRERLPIYQRTADHRILCREDAETTADEIIKERRGAISEI